MTYQAADSRYGTMTYNRCGRSGLKLPAVSLGLWHNFGDDMPIGNQRAMLRRALDLGITHFDQIGRDTSELQSLMRTSYAVFCLQKKTNIKIRKRKKYLISRLSRHP